MAVIWNDYHRSSLSTKALVFVQVADLQEKPQIHPDSECKQCIGLLCEGS